MHSFWGMFIHETQIVPRNQRKALVLLVLQKSLNCWDEVYETPADIDNNKTYIYIYINPCEGKFPSIAFCWALFKGFHDSEIPTPSNPPVFSNKSCELYYSDLKNNTKLKIPPKVMARLKISRNPLLNAPIFVMSGNNPIADILDHQFHYQPILQIQLIHL